MKKVLIIVAVFAIGLVLGAMVPHMIDGTSIVIRDEAKPGWYCQMTYNVTGFNHIERTIKVRNLTIDNTAIGTSEIRYIDFVKDYVTYIYNTEVL